VGAQVRGDGGARALSDWLRHPEVDRATLVRLVPELARCSATAIGAAIEDHRYAPYLARQDAEIARLTRDEAVSLPRDLDYSAIPGLSKEMVERLAAARPATLAAASRVRGVTPAALAAVLVASRRCAA
jgi:tRNA uridine 5-carboxymethylaminomethyl modification enzyme